MFMLMLNYKTVFLLILLQMVFFGQFASHIIDGSAVLILSHCPKFTDLVCCYCLFRFFLLLFSLTFIPCYIILVQTKFSIFFPILKHYMKWDNIICYLAF